MINKEQGAAEIRLTLENSIITAHHFDGTLLFSRNAVAGDWGRIWSAIRNEAAPVTPEKLETFLQQPGINIAGICSEAGITQQYLNRCRKDKKLPGAEVLNKLLPIIIKYGYK